MGDHEASIRIKLGQIEVDYQGDAAFLKKDLVATIKELLELQQQYPVASQLSSKDDDGSRAHTGKFNLSTDTIANKLGAKSGPDLVMAAAAHLHFVKGKATFSRTELIAEMRTAPGHFKDTYVNNLSTNLNGLKGAKDRLRLVGGDRYALSNKEKQALEANLANAE
jgi:hypothetical protein